MRTGELKIGDIVVFTDEAKLKLHPLDDSNSPYVVANIRPRGRREIITFTNKESSDCYWLIKV